MKRKLLTQMLAEWRSNLWMIIELIIVSTVLMYVFGMMFALADMYRKPVGFDLTDVYVANLQYVATTSDDYVPYDSVHSLYTDRDMLVAKIKANPWVDEVAAVTFNALPYQFNFWGNRLDLHENDTTYYYQFNERTVSPDYLRLIRLRGINGETTEQLVSILERGDVILSNTEPPRYWIPDPQIFIGKDLCYGDDTTRIVHAGAVAWGMRRNDFEPLYYGTLYVNAEPGNWTPKMAIRVKPGQGRQFVESLTAADKTAGNVYITEPVSIERMRDKAHLNIIQMIRNFSICAVFLLLVIFLGFLGSFWFRTQERVGEIALRKVNGATGRDIFRRFVGEGMMLLGVGVAIAAALTAVIFNTVEIGDLGDVLTGSTLIRGAALTAATLAALIIAGIWLPARKAMAVNPAYALKDQ